MISESSSESEFLFDKEASKIGVDVFWMLFSFFFLLEESSKFLVFVTIGCQNCNTS